MTKKRLRIVLVFLFIVLVIVAALFLRARTTRPPEGGLPPSGVSFKSLVPGLSGKSDAIETLGTPLNDVEADTLSFKSNNPNLPHQVVVPDETVLFIKEIVSLADKKTTEDITSAYGEAPYVLFGPDSVNGFNLYVYPDRGLAYLGHVEEPILLEIWYFQPTSFEDFKERWASNYSTTHSPIQ